MSEINWGLIRSGYTFQDLICSLIRLEDHNARLYVRPGKDYGQDAGSGDGCIIYQMKFHQDEAGSQAIGDAKKEAKKIAEYLETPGQSQEIWQGVKKWILISNVGFNPVNRSTWDKEIKPLFACLGLEASYWEKSEIETRLHKYPDLKQAYFGGETRVFLGLAEAIEQVRSQAFEHPNALDAHYHGRETELEQYKNFLLNDFKKILFIHGPGGIGKTRFLLEGAETQALAEGWQVLWANVETMTTTSSWFIGLIAERPTLLLIDEPDDAKVLKTLVEQISGGRAKTWKVAISVRSPNDLVLKYLQEPRIHQIVEELPLVPLEENAAVAFCKELMEFGSLQEKTTDWKLRAATWVAQNYDYPIWMAIAIKLLESKGNFETMPKELEGLASEYLREIIKHEQSLYSEQILNLLRWTALFDTVNREDPSVMEWIRVKIGCRNSTELNRYFDSLITRKVIFERGAYNRLLTIKPDVLADYILQNWLTYSRPSSSKLEASSEALEIVEAINTTLDATKISNIQKLLLRSIARFELIQQLSKKPLNLLGRLLNDWYERVPTMNARQKLAYFSLLDEISFAHVSEVLDLLRAVLNSTSAPETISTIFGQRIITHDDVILALPWIIYNIAPYAQTPSEQMKILSLLCDLMIAEHDVATRKAQGLPNDGKRSKDVLPRIIQESPEFLSNFETSAFEKAKELLADISSQGNIDEVQKLHLDALVKPLLSIEKEYTLFDRRTFKIQRWFITPDLPDWEIRHSLRTTIKEILSEQKLQPSEAVILWNLLIEAHREMSHATSDREEFRTVLIEDLQWVIDYLNSHNPDIQELTAARGIWDWHYQFDKDSQLKEIATQCENLFKNNELFPQYAPLINWKGYEVLGQWATETANKLISLNNRGSIYDFIKNGIKFLGNSDQIYRLFIVAYQLGAKAEESQAVRDFVEETLQLAVEDPEFQFSTRVCQSWVSTTRHNNSSATITLLGQLLEWANTSKKIVQLLQAIYESAWLINITDPEVAILLEQQEHFLQANSAVDFIGLLGGIFFSSYSPEKIRKMVETTLEQLNSNQLSYGVSALLKSLNYAMRSWVQNTDQSVDPSLKSWILDQVLRLPDIDALGGTNIYYVHDILQILGKPDLQWLVSAIEKRIQMFSESHDSSFRTLPSRERLSEWITPISPEQADDAAIRNLIVKLLSYADFSPKLGYSFPRYLANVDPSGVITADLVVEKLTDPKVKRNPNEVWQWAKFAGYYPEDSLAWGKIANAACSVAIHFDDRQKYSIFHALTNPEPKMWVSRIGEVPSTFEMAVETVQQRLETKAAPDPVLIPFWQWRLQLAEAELNREIERVKEEIEE
ncbi:ATP-binding protein [Planktothrix agardhii]|uniref:ATP-binding protein n=1 Tax=Planktothrix agardhii TaxID=1160 RepID=UPI00040B8F64|nr:ATP-binding protein [Planktothrix agardhii]CAD0230168.1 conserved hypothetical protein [Planktothrix agardhii]CAD5979815.1 hypothetical protein NO758_04494 [Planktothrix agardhii]